MDAYHPRLSFQFKVLIPVFGIMASLLAITTWVVDQRVALQLKKDADRQLNFSELVFQHFQEITANHLLLRFLNLANEPSLRAISLLEDPPTLKAKFADFIKELGDQMIGANVILFTSEDYLRHAVSGADLALDLSQFETNCAVSIRRVLESHAPNVDTILVSNRLFNIVSAPVSVSGHIEGVVTFGHEIGDTVANECRQMTGSEIVFLANDLVVVSTLQDAGQRRDFDARQRHFSGTIGRHRLPQVEASTPIVLGDEHFYWRAGQFDTLSGSAHLGYVLLSSYEKSLQSIRDTQRLLLWVRGAGLLLATIIVWWLLRRLTQPLRELRDGAEAVGRGDFSRRVRLRSRDEIGKLASTFNEMTENLKTSRAQLEQTVETLKATREQLHQSEKLSAVGEFVAGVTHELNNPLAGVIGFAYLLQESGVEEKQRRYLDAIVSSAQRCHKIVQSLLSFARQHPPERVLVNLNQLVEAALGILQYELRTSNIRVLSELNPQLPGVLADGHQIQQVLLNLLNNARQAVEAHRSEGWVRVRTEAAEGRARVLIQDSGPGISPENLGKIFNPFFTTKEVGKGTGLGLSLAYGIIQEHGGSIAARSPAGQGATFIVELPVAADVTPAVAETAAAPAGSAPAAKGGGKRVLAVDDEESLLYLVREALLSEGYQVDTANDGESALRQLRQKRYDLVLCDWKMPGLNGQQVYEQLQAFDPQLAARFIFTTGDVVGDKSQSYLREAGKVCLAKPFSLDELRRVVQKVSEHA